MKLTVNYYPSDDVYYIGHYTYLWKDGTLNKEGTGYIKAGSPKEMSDAPGYWKIGQEAQQFLDSWMPRKRSLTISHVERMSKLSKKEALDCSIEHWKQNVLDVENADIGSSYCAICMRAGDNNILSGQERCKRCIVNDYKWIEDINCCKEYNDFCVNRTEENAIAMLNKLVLIRNKKYGNPYIEKALKTNLQKAVSATATIYDEYVKMNELFGGNKMSKIVFDDGVEVKLSKETTDRLRKELVKPYQFKAGDVAKHSSTWVDDVIRIIVRADGKLKSYDRRGKYYSTGQKKFEQEGYKKIGELKDFIN